MVRDFEFNQQIILEKRDGNPKRELDSCPLDREREASMADEGGVSGAIMENEEGLGPEDWLEEQTGRAPGVVQAGSDQVA